jgi:hypothetical protein
MVKQFRFWGILVDIFINISCDSTVQTGDKIRFDLSKSFVPRPFMTAADITKIEVSPVNDGSFVTIHDSTIPLLKLSVKDWYFDWVYSSQSAVIPLTTTQEISFRFTASDLSTATKVQQVNLLTPVQDNLFSSDTDLIAHEPDILKWLPEGRSTWNYIHRRSQQRILSYLFEKGYKNLDGSPFTVAQILNKYDVKEWSTFMSLKIIFGSIINSKDDIFTEKSRFYENLEGKANKTDVRIDLNKDSAQGSSEFISTTGPMLVRR